MSTLGKHQGDGIRFNMYLSAPNGGVAQMLRNPEGQWVSWSDYEKLKAENERLRNAGDACADTAYAHCMCQDCEELRDQWRDAKRGNQR